MVVKYSAVKLLPQYHEPQCLLIYMKMASILHVQQGHWYKLWATLTKTHSFVILHKYTFPLFWFTGLSSTTQLAWSATTDTSYRRRWTLVCPLTSFFLRPTPAKTPVVNTAAHTVICGIVYNLSLVLVSAVFMYWLLSSWAHYCMQHGLIPRSHKVGSGYITRKIFQYCKLGDVRTLKFLGLSVLTIKTNARCLKSSWLSVLSLNVVCV